MPAPIISVENLSKRYLVGHRADRSAPFQYTALRAPDMVDEMNAFLTLKEGKKRLLDVGTLHGIFSLAFALPSNTRRVLAFSFPQGHVLKDFAKKALAQLGLNSIIRTAWTK
jgi:hypothetical protein